MKRKNAQGGAMRNSNNYSLSIEKMSQKRILIKTVYRNWRETRRSGILNDKKKRFKKERMVNCTEFC